MTISSLVHLAESIATEAHSGQFRRNGTTAYIEHPRSVVSRVGEDPEAQVVAWLHDVIEDTEQTEESLLAAGIPAHLVEAVSLVTKTQGFAYDKYLGAIAASPLASKVKIADMLANLAEHPSQKQIRKYAKGLLTLVKK